MNKGNILVIEDDKAIQNLIATTLEISNYSFQTASNYADGILKFTSYNPDVVILDLGLPDKDGIEIIKKVRTFSTVPIIVVSARTDNDDKINALDEGADDYLTKPFGMMELIARIRAVLRRTEDMQDKDESRPLVAGGICVDERAHTVFVNEQEVQLTLKEYQLLCLLMKNRGAVLTRDVLLENIWGYNNESETRTVDVHIRTLRQKLGAYGSLIETVRGVGYRLEADK